MSDEQTAIPEELSEALSENEAAVKIFAALPPSSAGHQGGRDDGGEARGSQSRLSVLAGSLQRQAWAWTDASMLSHDF